jgi:hypothetical protein
MLIYLLSLFCPVLCCLVLLQDLPPILREHRQRKVVNKVT